MSDFAVVEHATIFPQACLCGTQRGPLIDTRQEVGSTGMRHYICKLCAKQAAQLFGFASGEELDRLMDVRVQFEDYEQRLASQEKGIADGLRTIDEQERKIAALAEAKEAAEGEAARLRHLAEQVDERARELTSGLMAAPTNLPPTLVSVPADDDQGTGHA